MGKVRGTWLAISAASSAGAVALFQRWGWDYFSYRMGGGLRYHPGEAVSFEVLARQWHLEAAGTWMDRLRALRAVAEHPLNPRAAVEGALLDYIQSIRQPRTNPDETLR